jgi:hypothetical protein
MCSFWEIISHAGQVRFDLVDAHNRTGVVEDARLDHVEFHPSHAVLVLVGATDGPVNVEAGFVVHKNIVSQPTDNRGRFGAWSRPLFEKSFVRTPVRPPGGYSRVT